MTTIIHDRTLEDRIKAERVASGADRYDEVWEGNYVMAPMPNNEHQHLVAGLTRILYEMVSDTGQGIVLPGANVSDRSEDWQSNYRVPDVAVFLSKTTAENRGTFWLGGPDLAIEIVSTDDQTRQKLRFYGDVGTRELLIVDRDPWKLELYRLGEQGLEIAATTTPTEPTQITLTTCPLKLTLERSNESARPVISVATMDGSKSWLV